MVSNSVEIYENHLLLIDYTDVNYGYGVLYTNVLIIVIFRRTKRKKSKSRRRKKMETTRKSMTTKLSKTRTKTTRRS